MGIRLLPFELYFLTWAGFVWFSLPQISVALELLLVLDVQRQFVLHNTCWLSFPFYFVFHFLQRTKTLGLCLTFENYFWANLLKVWCGEFVYTSNFQYVGFRIKCLRRGQQKHVVFLVYLNSSSHVFLNMDLIIPVANNSYQTKTSPPDTHHFFTPQMILEGKTILCTIVSNSYKLVSYRNWNKEPAPVIMMLWIRTCILQKKDRRNPKCTIRVALFG